MYGNNNLFITINKNQSQPGSQHRIQISEQTELARMLIDLLGKPPTEQTKGMNPVSLKRYKKIFAKLSELDAEDKASLYPQLTPSVQVLYDMPAIQQALEQNEYLKKKLEDQMADARWLIANGA